MMSCRRSPARAGRRIACRSRTRRQSFLDALGSFGVDPEEDGGLEETFPASDPTTEQAPGGHPDPEHEHAAIAVAAPPRDDRVSVTLESGQSFELRHGDVGIAAITSCTNTSNPQVMVAAGLVAKKAVELGLERKPWVKSSLAPGSRVVTDYYERSGLDRFLDQLGFNTVGYGCTTCIGNSGPLEPEISAGIQDGDIVACAVLSGNRNFEARIHPEVKANYLASPPLVVAYALAGRMDLDLADGADRPGSGRRRCLPARPLADLARDPGRDRGGDRQ